MSNEMNSYRDFINRLSYRELAAIQLYARNRVLEPFTGHSGIETFQKADRTLNKGLEKVKRLGQKTGKLRIPGIKSERLKSILKSSQVLDRFGKATLDLSKITSSKFRDIEEWTREKLFDFIKKAIELFQSIDYEKWIVKKASQTLERPILDLNDVRNLTPAERDLLIQTLYPYKSNRYKKLLDSFDKTFNLVLGLIVATNIPGTGVLVSLINIARTVIRLSNSINSMSAIHGYQVKNFAHLFRVCTALIHSLGDWDSNKDHIPLKPELLVPLYQSTDEEFEKELIKLLEAAGTKDLYIAVPGVGMLSLGKINLDNFKLNALVLNLIQDYALEDRISLIKEKEFYKQAISDFQLIYASVKDMNYHRLMRMKKEEKGVKISARMRFGKVFGSAFNSESRFNALSRELNEEVCDIFRFIAGIPQEQKDLEIKNRLMAALGKEQKVENQGLTKNLE